MEKNKEGKWGEMSKGDIKDGRKWSRPNVYETYSVRKKEENRGECCFHTSGQLPCDCPTVIMKFVITTKDETPFK